MRSPTAKPNTPAPLSSITLYPVEHSPPPEYPTVRSSLYFDKSRRPGSAGESHWPHLGQANIVITSPCSTGSSGFRHLVPRAPLEQAPVLALWSAAPVVTPGPPLLEKEWNPGGHAHVAHP